MNIVLFLHFIVLLAIFMYLHINIDVMGSVSVQEKLKTVTDKTI